jgi:pyruvate kinase
VLTAGTLQGVSGSTDLLKVEVVTAVRGQGVGFGEGSVSGRARILKDEDDVSQFLPDEILVTRSTTAKYVDAIKKAKGVITEDGNVTGHAVTIGMRLDKPVIVGVTDAVSVIRDGEIVTMDLDRGVVYSGSHTSFHDRGDD